MSYGTLRLTEQQFAEIQARMKTGTVPPGLFSEPKPNKFNAVICEADGLTFRSKKERQRYLELTALKSVGECWFLWQVPFRLPGKTKYVLDFLVFWKDGRITFEDTKGHRTAQYIKNKKQVEALYPVTISEL